MDENDDTRHGNGSFCHNVVLSQEYHNLDTYTNNTKN